MRRAIHAHGTLHKAFGDVDARTLETAEKLRMARQERDDDRLARAAQRMAKSVRTALLAREKELDGVVKSLDEATDQH